MSQIYCLSPQQQRMSIALGGWPMGVWDDPVDLLVLEGTQPEQPEEPEPNQPQRLVVTPTFIASKQALCPSAHGHRQDTPIDRGERSLLRLLAVSVSAATVTVMQLRHICEVCGVEEVLTPDDAHQAGWDYPPRMGVFGAIGPRTCPRCSISRTVWWALTMDGFTSDMLTQQQHETIARIAGEPQTVMVSLDGGE